MHPTFRQVPPKTPSSSRATRRSANCSSMIELPEHEPMTARSKWSRWRCSETFEGRPTPSILPLGESTCNAHLVSPRLALCEPGHAAQRQQLDPKCVVSSEGREWVRPEPT